MKRNGLRKIVKSVRGRKGSVRRSYWIKASADQKLERGLGILGSGLGSRLGQKIGTRIGPLTAVIGKWTARKEVAGWFGGALIGGASGSFAGFKAGHRVGASISKRIRSPRVKSVIGTFAAITGTAIHANNLYRFGRTLSYVPGYLNEQR